jgi:hypothetical protein
MAVRTTMKLVTLIEDLMPDLPRTALSHFDIILAVLRSLNLR